MALLRIYALTTIILALKMSAISIAQGRARVAAGAFLNPEDARTFNAKEVQEEAPAVQRAARAWRNDLENIPIFLILGWIYVAAGLSVGAFEVYCIVFVVARIAHTILYLKAVQPLRTISYAVGALATLALIIHIFVEVVLA